MITEEKADVFVLTAAVVTTAAGISTFTDSTRTTATTACYDCFLFDIFYLILL